jgi:hypothetical protein
VLPVVVVEGWEEGEHGSVGESKVDLAHPCNGKTNKLFNTTLYWPHILGKYGKSQITPDSGLCRR